MNRGQPPRLPILPYPKNPEALRVTANIYLRNPERDTETFRVIPMEPNQP